MMTSYDKDITDSYNIGRFVAVLSAAFAGVVFILVYVSCRLLFKKANAVSDGLLLDFMVWRIFSISRSNYSWIIDMLDDADYYNDFLLYYSSYVLYSYTGNVFCLYI